MEGRAPLEGLPAHRRGPADPGWNWFGAIEYPPLFPRQQFLRWESLKAPGRFSVPANNQEINTHEMAT